MVFRVRLKRLIGSGFGSGVTYGTKETVAEMLLGCKALKTLSFFWLEKKGVRQGETQRKKNTRRRECGLGERLARAGVLTIRAAQPCRDKSHRAAQHRATRRRSVTRVLRRHFKRSALSSSRARTSEARVQRALVAETFTVQGTSKTSTKNTRS